MKKAVFSMLTFFLGIITAYIYISFSNFVSNKATLIILFALLIMGIVGFIVSRISIWLFTTKTPVVVPIICFIAGEFLGAKIITFQNYQSEVVFFELSFLGFLSFYFFWGFHFIRLSRQTRNKEKENNVNKSRLLISEVELDEVTENLPYTITQTGYSLILKANYPEGITDEEKVEFSISYPDVELKFDDENFLDRIEELRDQHPDTQKRMKRERAETIVFPTEASRNLYLSFHDQISKTPREKILSQIKESNQISNELLSEMLLEIIEGLDGKTENQHRESEESIKRRMKILEEFGGVGRKKYDKLEVSVETRKKD